MYIHNYLVHLPSLKYQLSRPNPRTPCPAATDQNASSPQTLSGVTSTPPPPHPPSPAGSQRHGTFATNHGAPYASSGSAAAPPRSASERVPGVVGGGGVVVVVERARLQFVAEFRA